MLLSDEVAVLEFARSISSPISSLSSTASRPEMTTTSNAPAPPSTSRWSTPCDQTYTAFATLDSITPTTPAMNAPRRDRPNR